MSSLRSLLSGYLLSMSGTGVRVPFQSQRSESFARSGISRITSATLRWAKLISMNTISFSSED